LAEGDRETLQAEVAGLPSELETDEIEARLFDLIAFKLQLASVQGDQGTFEMLRQRVVEVASLLEEKGTIPAVQAQLGFLAQAQEAAYWEEMDVHGLEDLRLQMRGLMAFLDRKKKTIVYTDFKDEVMGVRDAEVVHVPTMTGPQYEKKVRDYLRNHEDHLVIHRLRSNQPLTDGDLKGLEQSLMEIGEDDGETLLAGLLERSDAPYLAYLVRSMVGMDRAAAKAAFGDFLSNHSLTPKQIRFVEMVIDQLTSRGVLRSAALYEAPFINLHAGGPEALFAGKENVIEGVFRSLKKLHTGLTA
ncbi:MAG: type I restriction enzyme R subunit, partial [Planctomycetota bacterium]